MDTDEDAPLVESMQPKMISIFDSRHLDRYLIIGYAIDLLVHFILMAPPKMPRDFSGVTAWVYAPAMCLALLTRLILAVSASKDERQRYVIDPAKKNTREFLRYAASILLFLVGAMFAEATLAFFRFLLISWGVL